MNPKSPVKTPSTASHQPVPAPVVPLKRDLGLILAIIFASAAISGSLVFFGMQMGGKGGDVQVEKIEQAFENFVKKQQNQQVEDQQVAQEEKEKKAADLAKANMKPVSKTGVHIRGNLDAKVSMVVYSDFECPYCKKFDSIAKQVVDSYGGKVNWVHRHYPLPFHDPMATKESMASECVAEQGGNDKFWAFSDAVFERTQSGGNGLSDQDLNKIVADIGLNQSQFTTCLNSDKYKSKVVADTENGSSSGVEGTPGSVLVNNETGEFMFIEGAQKLDTFKKKIDELMK